MRQLKKRDLNREAQRRFRDRQKQALAMLESTTQVSSSLKAVRWQQGLHTWACGLGSTL
jgi:hypothetical protein